MKLTNILEDVQLCEYVVDLTMAYYNLYDEDGLLMETVDGDCRFKEVVMKNGNSLKTIKQKGLTDLKISKIKTKQELDMLIKRIDSHNAIEDKIKCKKAIINKFIQNHRAEDEKTVKDGDMCKLPEFDSVLAEIKQVIKRYVLLAKKYKIKIEFNESLDSLLIAYPTMIRLNEADNNSYIGSYLNQMVDVINSKMDNILTESLCDIAKLSKYIVILRGIKRELMDLISPLQLDTLNQVIDKYTAHYNKFKG